MMDTKEEQMRAEFEAWYDGEFPELSHQHGDTRSKHYRTWKAALNSQAKSVPEPTKEMLEAAVKQRWGDAVYKAVTKDLTDLYEAEALEDYKAMFAAAPQPPQEDMVRETLLLVEFILNEYYPEFEEDLDETGCPNGFYTCPACDGGGGCAGKGYKEIPLTHYDGCKNHLAREAIKDLLAAMKESNTLEGGR